MAYNVLDISNKILAKGSEESYNGGELISNMKLQKLLYYMQGFHLAYFNTPLFDEEIEAWMYGPVVPSMYRYFQDNEDKGIPYNDQFITLDSPEEERLFNDVFRVYGQYSAIGLMNLTHNEIPWKTTPIGHGNIITKDKLKLFFKKRLRKHAK